MMPRIEPRKPRNPLTRLVDWMARRRYGQTLQPLRIVARHGRVLAGYTGMEFALSSSRKLEGALKSLITLRAAQHIGCPF